MVFIDSVDRLDCYSRSLERIRVVLFGFVYQVGHGGHVGLDRGVRDGASRLGMGIRA